MRHSYRNICPKPRQAFTLIELLVVIVVIIVLVALTAASYFYFVGNTQQKATDQTIRSVNKIFQAQWSYVVEQAKKETPSAAVIAAANGDQSRAQVLWVKIRLMEAFPMSFSEINDPTDSVYKLLVLAIPANQRKTTNSYQRLTGGAKAAPNPATESAACLLMALSVSRGGSSLSPDQIAGFTADTDGDGIKEIVDGWRSPLAFYRFAWGTGALPGSPGAPQGIQGLNPAPPGSKAAIMADPLDPAGLLFSWPAGPGRTAYEMYAHKIATPAGTGANYVIPVIMSIGPDNDKVAGTFTPSVYSPVQCATNGLTVQNASTAPDNTYSFNLSGS